MPEPIFLRHHDGTLAEMSESAYDSEAVLQDLLAAHPRLLIGADALSSRRLLLVAKEAQLADSEAGAARWAVDHLFIDDLGVPMIVEVKRSTDTRIRREVVGQMLDYAANAVLYWPVERLESMFTDTCRRMGTDPDSAIQQHTGPEVNPATFWQTVGTNLQAGRVRLVFVADQIPPELRRIIEFLNGQMTQADVLGVEVRRYVGQDAELLVPSFIGQTSAAERAKSATGRATRSWDEASFLSAVGDRRGTSDQEVARRLIDWCRHQFPRFYFGSGASDGSFIPVVDGPRSSFYPIAAWTYGRVEIQFQYILSVKPFDNIELRRELQHKLNAIDGVHIPDDRLAKRPSIPFTRLADDAAFHEFARAIAWAISQFKGANR